MERIRSLLKVAGTVAAVLVAVALIAGLQSRSLARTNGSPPPAAGECRLCNGAPTAASTAPSLQSVSLPVAPVAMPVVAVHPLASPAAGPRIALLARPPDAPPPRA